MKFIPVKSGGRIVQGDTPYGRFRIEWDADGQLVSEEIEIREPAASPPPKPSPSERSPSMSNPLLPGTLLARLIRLLTGVRPGDRCGCSGWVAAMDRDGWVNTLRARQAVYARLADQARRRGHYINSERPVLGLLQAGLVELLSRLGVN